MTMKWLLALLLSIGFISSANAQINQLPNAALPLTGNEFIALDQPQGLNYVTVKSPLSGLSIVGLSITVPNNTQLKASNSTTSSIIIRLGFAAPGDGGYALYNWSATNCTSPDDGAQVQPTVTGCWIADFAASKPTPLVWGAKGDGTTNDTAPLQAAINATAGVRVLEFGPSSSAFIATQLTFPTKTHIVGYGWPSMLKQANGQSGDFITYAVGSADIVIEGMNIDCNRSGSTATTTGGRCIAMGEGGSTNPVIRNSKIHDSANDLIAFAGSGAKIVDNWLFNCGKSGGFGNAGCVENYPAGPASNFQMIGNFVTDANGPGLACGFDNCSVGIFNNNVIIRPGQGTQPADCVTAYSITNTNIQANDNQCYNSGNSGISLGGSRIAISGNIIDTAAANCISLNGVRGYIAGTVTLTNGSKVVTGTGTLWSGAGFLDGGWNIELQGVGFSKVVSLINSNTSATLATNYVGANLTNVAYSLKQQQSSVDVTIANNVCKGALQNGLLLTQLDGFSVTGNRIKTPGQLGIWMVGGVDGSLSLNSVTGAGSQCYYINAESAYDLGTISVTNGSSAITGMGTLWTEALPKVAGGIVLRIGEVDGINYQATIVSDTTATLTSPATYQGVTNAVSTYTMAFKPPGSNSYVGNVGRNCGRDAMFLANLGVSTVSANDMSGALAPGSYGITEYAGSTGNVFDRSNKVYNNANPGVRRVPDNIPAVSACGTAPNITGTSVGGLVGIGSGTVTACTLTFASTFYLSPTCIGQLDNGVAVSVTGRTASSVTFGFAANSGGQFLDYLCRQTGN